MDRKIEMNVVYNKLIFFFRFDKLTKKKSCYSKNNNNHDVWVPCVTFVVATWIPPTADKTGITSIGSEKIVTRIQKPKNLRESKKTKVK